MRATVVTGMPLRIVMSSGHSVREVWTRIGPLIRRRVGATTSTKSVRSSRSSQSAVAQQVAERGALAGRVHAGEPQTVTREPAMSERVDALIDVVQPAIADSSRDRLAAQAGREQLHESQEPVLPRRDPSQDEFHGGGGAICLAMWGLIATPQASRHARVTDLHTNL